MDNANLSSDISDNNIFKGMIVCKCCKRSTPVKKPNQVKKIIINMNNENIKQ